MNELERSHLQMQGHTLDSLATTLHTHNVQLRQTLHQVPPPDATLRDVRLTRPQQEQESLLSSAQQRLEDRILKDVHGVSGAK